MGKQAITAGAAQVRAYRLAAHHLARPLPAGAFAQAAGVRRAELPARRV